MGTFAGRTLGHPGLRAAANCRRDKPCGRVIWTLIAVLVAVMATISPAEAAPSPLPMNHVRAQALQAHLGDHAVGYYFDRASGRFVFQVTGPQAAAAVEAAGGVARIAKFGPAQLATVKDRLRRAAVSGLAWWTDLVADRVHVEIEPAITKSGLARLAEVKRQYGALMQVQRNRSAYHLMSTTEMGGRAIYATESDGTVAACSLGFNVTNSSNQYFFLTAGHCIQASKTWYADSARTIKLGTVLYWIIGGSLGKDYAVVQYSNSAIVKYGAVDLHNSHSQDITSAGSAYTGELVSSSGGTTAYHPSGVVTATGVSITIGGETLTGMVQTYGMCLRNGDSGGALFTGTVALGTEVAGTDDCHDLFNPIQFVLQRYGLSVY